jgi:hypothetical protein
MKARCYYEFCCNQAVHYVVHVWQPDGWKGRWGWCDQHVHLSWEERSR